MYESPTHTISIAGSKLSWNDVDARAKKYGFNRSKYTQYLYEKDINPTRRKQFKDNVTIFLLSLLVIMVSILIFMVMVVL